MFGSTKTTEDKPVRISAFFDGVDIHYIQTLMIILCCLVYLLKELIPDLKDKVSTGLSFIVKVIGSILFMYSLVVHSPWKGIVDSFIYAWANKLIQ